MRGYVHFQKKSRRMKELHNLDDNKAIISGHDIHWEMVYIGKWCTLGAVL
jgi:hypothetical protein